MAQRPQQQQRTGNEGSVASRFAGADPKFFTIEKFQGINTQAKRESIHDEQFAWLENMMPVGDGNMRSLYTNGASIYTAPGGKTIVYFYFFNVGETPYVAVFLNDGTAVGVNVNTSVTTTISANPGQFYPGSAALNQPLPACAQYGQSGIIIVTTAESSGYFAWDGATLTAPGQPAPNWLTNTTPTTMPSGISGTCVETFSSRVWVGNGANFLFSAAGNGADFTGSDGAGSSPSSDSFLRREFTQIRQANGFLYLFADSSINVISNVQSSGSPTVITTFNNQNVDPQTGAPWHNSVQAFGRGLVFGNSVGVYALYGGAAEKVSDDLDGIFFAAQATLQNDTSIGQPSSASMTIYDIRTYMLLVPVQGPFDNSPRLALVMWDGKKKWWIGSQTSSLTFVATQEINSVLQAYGTDGMHLFPLFATSSASLSKVWQTRLWPGAGFQVTKQAMRLYTMGVDNSGSGYTFNGTLDYILENEGLGTTSWSVSSNTFIVQWQNSTPANVQWQNGSSANVNWTVSGPSLRGIGGSAISARGNYLGLTVSSTSPDFSLITQSLLYRDDSPIGG